MNWPFLLIILHFLKLKQTVKEGHGWQTQYYDSCSPAWFSVLLGRQQLSPGSLLPLVTAVVNQVVPGESCCLLGRPGQKALLDCGSSLSMPVMQAWWGHRLSFCVTCERFPGVKSQSWWLSVYFADYYKSQFLLVRVCVRNS